MIISNICQYINMFVGGIVDRNSHKGITLEKATAQGMQTAKLPIKEYAELRNSTVLTVNHVVEMLLLYNECHSWETAVTTVIPNRKRKCTESTGTGSGNGSGVSNNIDSKDSCVQEEEEEEGEEDDDEDEGEEE